MFGFDRKTRTRRDNTMYKNPRLGVTYKGPGYFHTRHLDVNGKANMAAYIEALGIANDKMLFDKAEAKVQVEKEKELQQHREALRKQRIEKAGPALLEALQGLITWAATHFDADFKGIGDSFEMYEEWKVARAAIAKAEAE